MVLLNKRFVTLVFVAFLLFAALGAAMLNKMTFPKPQEPLRVAFDYNKALTHLDPAQVNVLSEAILLRNLYSSLFEYDLNGGIVTGLAESFEWLNGELRIDLRQEPVMSSGRVVSPGDVVLSLKRLMVSDKNLHGDLKEILCPGVKLANISAECPGLTSNEKSVFLKPASDRLAKLLIPLLATVDYRILPAEAFDQSKPDIPIFRFDVTSGPYFATAFDTFGNVELQANPHHYAYSPNMPQKVHFLSLSGSEAVSAFVSGHIDVIPTSTAITASDLAMMQEQVPDLHLSKTFNLKIKMIFFGRSALSKFSPAERFALAREVRPMFNKIILPFEQPTIEFFQDFASGYLTDDQRQVLTNQRESASVVPPKTKAKLGLITRSASKWSTFLAEHKNFEASYSDVHPLEQTIEDRPDIFGGINDVAFNRSISVLSYNLRQGVFGLFENQSERWLQQYFEASNENDTLTMINKLHFDALTNCVLYPLAAAPYTLFARGGWKGNLNPYFSSTELWTIRKT